MTDLTSAPAPAPADGAAPVLEIENLEVSFRTHEGTVHAVRGVDLTIYENETLGIVGESGSGKSVTMLAVMGLLPRTATVTGSARYRGEELLGKHGHIFRYRGGRIAMIFQDPLTALNPVHKVGDQIAEAVLAHHGKEGKKAAGKRAIELLDVVGIPQASLRADQYPHEFSGGMRQRAMIAMAIANDPDVLIADEPTTALDVTVQAQILEVIQRAQELTNSAVVFITHDLGVIARLATRVQVMYAGRVAEIGTVDEIFYRPGHPYTRGLLDSLPSLDSDGGRLQPILGSPPSMLSPPPGCAFHPRCPRAEARCAEEQPVLHVLGPTHVSACHFAEELAR